MNTIIPSKVAVDGRVGFLRPAEVSRYRITLDGDGIRPVVAFDLDNQWVEVYTLDDHGKPVARNDEFTLERRYGDIKVSFI